jgi:hypothetical protein
MRDVITSSSQHVVGYVMGPRIYPAPQAGQVYDRFYDVPSSVGGDLWSNLVSLVELPCCLCLLIKSKRFQNHMKIGCGPSMAAKKLNIVETRREDV